MGVFGSFDGPDGCGKSTLLAGVIEYLTSRGVLVRAAPAFGDFLPTGNSADAFRDWVLSNDGMKVAASLIKAASIRLEAIMETEDKDTHILLIDRGSLTVKLSAIAHGIEASGSSEQQVIMALTEPLQELAAFDKRVSSLMTTRSVVILPRLGMKTIERRISTNEIISDRYFRYLTVLHRLFRDAPMDGSHLIAAENKLFTNVNLVGDLLLKAKD